MGYCPLRCSAIFRSSRSVVVYFRPHGNMIGGARPGRGALVQMHCQGEACITNHFRRLNGSMTKNYGIIGEIRIQRKKITVSPPAGQCIENGFGWLRPISLMFFWGATVHILLYRRWPLKSILHSLFYGISTGCLKYHANARVSSIGFG